MIFSKQIKCVSARIKREHVWSLKYMNREDTTRKIQKRPRSRRWRSRIGSHGASAGAVPTGGRRHILGVGEIRDCLPYNSVKVTEFTRRSRTLGNETSTLTSSQGSLDETTPSRGPDQRLSERASSSRTEGARSASGQGA